MTGIPVECQTCAAPLTAHNLTGLCAECRLVLRNNRLPSNTEETK